MSNTVKLTCWDCDPDTAPPIVEIDVDAMTLTVFDTEDGTPVTILSCACPNCDSIQVRSGYTDATITLLIHAGVRLRTAELEAT